MESYNHIWIRYKNKEEMMSQQSISPKVLIVEPHPYHQEILPGFVKYFNELGYDVYCYIRQECRNSNVFCKMPIKPNITYYDYTKLADLLTDCSQYDYVFFSSLEFMSKDFQGKITDFLGYIPNAKHGIMGCHHTLTNIKDYDSVDLLNQNRVFSCSGFKYNRRVVPMLAPIYYGNFKPSKLHKKKQFVVVGAITSYSKNHNLLFTTVEKLKNDGLKNFKITVIGKGRLKVPFRLRRYIKFKGSVPFNKMFKYVNNADFYLPLLDLQLENHLRYLTNCCTGSRNLILGFKKPCLINDVFASVYKFDKNNAILYHDNDLYAAMKNALTVTKDEYHNLQTNLESLGLKIYTESFNNLKKAVGK